MSLQYYEDNAEQFAQNTLDVDMSELHERFLAHLPPTSRVLDAGCGAGRDAATFIQLGYQVDAFDASQKLVKIAKKVSGISVQLSTFLNFRSKHSYAGIWACASLLHVPTISLPATLKYLGELLEPKGVMYVSFKYGEDESVRSGRHFTNCTEDRLEQFLKNTGLLIKEVWINTDKRPDRDNEQWLNALLTLA